MNKQTIRDFYNRIVGYIEEDPATKKQTAYSFYMRKLGTYDPKDNTTRDFYNRIVAKGNTLVSLIYKESDNEKNKK